MNLDKLKESARKYEQGGQWRHAVDVYKKALREFEESGEGVPDPSLYNRVGDLEMKSGDSGAAVRAYEQAADLYTEQGFFNNAIALCGKILRINASRTATYLRLAQLNARKNFVGEARKNLLEYVDRMEALNHREEAFNAVRVFAHQFTGNPDIRVMLVELLTTAADGHEGRTQFRTLAEELESRDDGPVSPIAGDLTQIPDVDTPAPSPLGGRAGGLVFIDVGAAGRVPDAEPVEGLELHRPDEGDSDGWRRDTSAVEGLDVISGDVDDDPDAPVISSATPVDPFAAADPDSMLDIDAYPPVEDQEDLELTFVDLDADATRESDPSVALPFQTLEDATHADPRQDVVGLDRDGDAEDADQDLVFLSVDEGAAGDAPTTASPTSAVDDDPAVAARNRAEVLLDVGDQGGAVAALEDAVQRFEATGRYEEALEVADHLSRLEPAQVFRYQKRVELAYRCGRRDVMLQAYLGLADALLRNGGTDHAVVVYRRVLEHDPGNAIARAALANLAPAPPAAAEEPEPPAGSFIDLGSLILDEPSTRDTRIRVGQAAPIEDEDQAFHEALAQFKRGIDENLDAEDFQAHYDLGIAFKEMGLLDEAIAQFQKALRAPEGRLKTSEQLGIAFYEKTRFAISEAVLRRAIDSLSGGDEDKIGLIYWLGRAVESQRRQDEAIRCYERVLAVDIRFLDVGDRMQRLTAEPT
jgi:tetratricopeptide (TPR) repeat protein